MKNNTGNRPRFLFGAILLIIVLGFVVYGNSFRNEFLFDDIGQIERNPVIRDLANIPKVFAHDLTYFTPGWEKTGFFRPMQSLSLMADHYLWALAPVGYHITNTILHILVSIALFMLVAGLSGSTLLSCIAALLYLVHPAHTEAVAYISGRADSLCAVFLLLMVIFQRSYWQSTSPAQRAARYCMVFLSFVLALLSKELAVIFPIVLIFCEYCLRDRQRYTPMTADRAMFYVPLFAAAGAWLLAKNGIVKVFIADPRPLGVRLVLLPQTLFGYVKLSFLPVNLHMEYTMPAPGSLLRYVQPAALLFLGGFLYLVYYMWRRGASDRDHRMIFFGLGWFLITLLPSLNIIVQLNAPFAEHWLYVPAMGLILAVVYAALYYSRAKKWIYTTTITLCAAVIAVFSFLTVKQNAVWKDPITFYVHTIKHSPFSPKSYNNLAYEYVKRGEVEKAKAILRDALRVDPDCALAKENLEMLEKGITR
jgi:hypothetical protein